MADKGVLIVEQIPRLRRYARALTGDASRADDLVHSRNRPLLGDELRETRNCETEQHPGDS